jgi:hypothetical protein
MKQAKTLLAMACVLLAGTVLGEDNSVQQQEKDERRLRNIIHEQGFEQVISASVYDPRELPRSGLVPGEHIALLQDAIKLKNAFKLIAWGLCVSPRSEKDGTVLVIESVQKQHRANGHFIVEATYRPVKKPSLHPDSEVWPYALFVVKGWPDEIVCREAQ